MQLSENSLTLISVLIGSGGLLGSIALLARLRTDKDKVIVESAQGSVTIARQMNEALVLENARLKKRCEDAEEDFEAYRKEAEARIEGLLKMVETIDDRQNPVNVVLPETVLMPVPQALLKKGEPDGGS